MIIRRPRDGAVRIGIAQSPLSGRTSPPRAIGGNQGSSARGKSMYHLRRRLTVPIWTVGTAPLRNPTHKGTVSSVPANRQNPIEERTAMCGSTRTAAPSELARDPCAREERLAKGGASVPEAAAEGLGRSTPTGPAAEIRRGDQAGDYCRGLRAGVQEGRWHDRPHHRRGASGREPKGGVSDRFRSCRCSSSPS